MRERDRERTDSEPKINTPVTAEALGPTKRRRRRIRRRKNLFDYYLYINIYITQLYIFINSKKLKKERLHNKKKHTAHGLLERRRLKVRLRGRRGRSGRDRVGTLQLLLGRGGGTARVRAILTFDGHVG